MNIIAIIPARGNSKGIPNKNLSTEKSNEQSNGDDDNDNIHNLI